MAIHKNILSTYGLPRVFIFFLSTGVMVQPMGAHVSTYYKHVYVRALFLAHNLNAFSRTVATTIKNTVLQITWLYL